MQRKKIAEILVRSYDVKDLLSSYLVTESNFLREKLLQLTREIELKKISAQEYESNASQILEALSKITKLNDEETALLNKIKNKMMGSYEKDKGISQQKIEEKLIKK